MTPSPPNHSKPIPAFNGMLRALTSDAEQFDWKSVVKMIAFAIVHPRVTRNWLRHLESPEMTRLWERQPRLIDKPIRPYMNANWGVVRRIDSIKSHYRWLNALMRPTTIERFFRPAPVLLAAWNLDNKSAQLSLCLSYNGSFEREGELTLGLYRQVGIVLQPCTPKDLIVSLTFSMVSEGEANSVLYIGCIQAQPAPNILETLRSITKQCFGLRPKALLVEAAKSMARRWNAELKGIDPDVHPFTSLRYRLSSRKRAAVASMRAMYLSLWSDFDGQATSSGWFDLPRAQRLRADSEVPVHKRRMYAQRNAFLQHLDLSLNTALDGLENPHKDALSPYRQDRQPNSEVTAA